MDVDTLKKNRFWRCIPQSLLFLFQNPQTNSKSKHSKLCLQPFQYFLVFFTLLYHKIRNYFRKEMEKPELFILKLIFIFFIYKIYASLLPHIDDISHMEFDLSDQTELFLLNSGFKKPKIEDLSMLSEYRVAFAGMVKNAENTLPELINQLQILGCGFKYSHFFVLESNSNDHTRELIKNWSENPGNCKDIHNNLIKKQSYISNSLLNTYVSQGYELELTQKYKKKYDEMHSSYNNKNNNKNKNNNDNLNDIAAMQAMQANAKNNKNKNKKHKNNNNNENDENNRFFDKYNNNNKIFDDNGILEVTGYQPEQEFEEISQLMQRRDTENYGEVREERYVVYRNFLLEKVINFDKHYFAKTGNHIDYVFWIDMDLRGFDVQMVAHEFSYAWRAGFDIVCGNGVKYTGWYYDSYASVYEDGVWAYGNPRWRISNRIRSERFYEMKSCFGGLAAYNLPLLSESTCKYEHFGWAYAQVPSFARFADIYHIDRTCEHLPINFCLREHGAKLAVASQAHTFYGTGDVHG